MIIDRIIDWVAGYGVVIGAIFCIVWAISHIVCTPRTRHIIRSGDIVKAIEMKERKCGCGIFVACADCSREYDRIDEQLKQEGKK